MATFHIDPVAGNDANSGVDWANAWQTITLGATAARIGAGDLIKIAKSPDPVSIGTCVWDGSGPVGVTVPITSSTNATPIVITRNNHGFVVGDVVHITGHTTNTEANGVWYVSAATTNTLTLEGSSGNGTGGATGTMRKVNNRCVVGSSAFTKKIDRCNVAWTAVTGLVTVVNSTPTNGGSGYTVGDILTIITGGTTAKVIVNTVGGSGNVTNVSVYAGGKGGYTTGSGKVTSGGTGTGCTVNITTIGSSSVSLSPVSVTKEGDGNVSVTAPTNVKPYSKLAYRSISPTDFSSYDALTAWLFQNTAIGVDGARLALCSDTSGNTIVNEFIIPSIPCAGRFAAFVATQVGGGALFVGIQSVAVYTGGGAYPSASTIRLDAIAACTVGSVNYTSLISPCGAATGSPEDGGWYGIRSIHGRVIEMDLAPDTAGYSFVSPGWVGATQSVETWIRSAHTQVAASLSSPAATTNEAGGEGSPITYSGGWNPANGLQDGETFFDGLGGLGYGFQLSHNLNNIERLSFVKYNYGVVFGSSKCDVSTYCLANNNYAALMAGYACRLSAANANNNNEGVTFAGGRSCELHATRAYGNRVYGVKARTCVRCSVVDCDLKGNGNYGLFCAYEVAHFTAKRVAISDSSIGCVSLSDGVADLTFIDCTFDAPPEFIDMTQYADNTAYSHNHNLSGQHRIVSDGVQIDSDTTDRVGGAGLMWTFTGTSSVRTPYYPATLVLGRFMVRANELVTARAWIKKSHATDVACRLVCRGDQVAGVPADVSAYAAVATTAWQQVEIQFTPTADGVVELEAWAEGLTVSLSCAVEQNIEVEQAT